MSTIPPNLSIATTDPLSDLYTKMGSLTINSTPTIVDELPADDLTLVNNYTCKIGKAYEHFSTRRGDLSLLPSAIAALTQLEALYAKIYKVDSQKGEKIRPSVEEARKYVQEMNMKSPTLTGQDIRALQNFFTKPIENFYKDPETGKTYVQPDHSQLLKISGAFCVKGNYEGFGLCRKVKIKDRLCDILYLNKHEEQIWYEFKRYESMFNRVYSYTLNYMWPDSFKKMENQIARQMQLANALLPKIDVIYKKWKYDSYEFSAFNTLHKLVDLDCAKKHHAIIFYYKEVQNADLD